MNSKKWSRVSEHACTKQRSISQPSQRLWPDLRAHQRPLAVWPVSGGCFNWEETTEKGTTAERTLRSQLSALVLLLERLALMRWLPRDLLNRRRDELHWCWPALKKHFKEKIWRLMYSVCSCFPAHIKCTLLAWRLRLGWCSGIWMKTALSSKHRKLVSWFKDIIWKPCPWISPAPQLLQYSKWRWYALALENKALVLLPEIRWHQREI